MTIAIIAPSNGQSLTASNQVGEIAILIKGNAQVSKPTTVLAPDNKGHLVSTVTTYEVVDVRIWIDGVQSTSIPTLTDNGTVGNTLRYSWSVPVNTQTSGDVTIEARATERNTTAKGGVVTPRTSTVATNSVVVRVIPGPIDPLLPDVVYWSQASPATHQTLDADYYARGYRYLSLCVYGTASLPLFAAVMINRDVGATGQQRSSYWTARSS